MIINCNTDLNSLCQSVGPCCNPCSDAKLILTSKGLYTNVADPKGINLKEVGIKVDAYTDSNPQIASYGSALISPSHLHLLYTQSKNLWWAYYSDVYQYAIALNSILKFAFTTTHFDQNNLTLQATYTATPFNEEVTFTWENINDYGWVIQNNWDLNWTWNQIADRALQNAVLYPEFSKTEEIILPYTPGTQIATGEVKATLGNGDFTFDITYTITANFSTNTYAFALTSINLFGTVFKLNVPKLLYSETSTVTAGSLTAATEYKAFALNALRLHSVNQILSLAAYEKESILIVNQGLTTDGVKIVDFNLPADFDKDSTSCGC